MQFDRQIRLSVANTRYGPWQVQTCALSEFYTRLSSPARSQERRAAYLALKKSEQDRLKDVGGFVGGALTDGVRRSGHVAGRDLITLDVDKLEPGGARRVLQICETLGCGYAVYSTRKHAPEAPRLRIILPLATELSADEYEPAARKAMQIIDPTMQMWDRTTAQAERLMYWPSVCSDGEYVFYYADKPLVDGKALLATFDWKDVSQWPRCPDEDASVRRTASKQQDPTEKEGIVGAFCRVYDIYSAMEQFIPGVYEPVAGCDYRYTFVGGSTAGGAVVYENGKFLYSHHATDPAGGQLCNAFDLVRLHLFGDQDDDVKVGTPVVKYPSWAAMCKLAESDPQVRAQKISDRADQIRRDFSALIERSEATHAQQTNPLLSMLTSANAGTPSGTSAETSSTAPASASPAQPPSETVDVVAQLAQLLEDSKNKVTSGLVAAAMNAIGVRIGRNEITNRVIIDGMPSKYSEQEAVNVLPILISDILRENGVNAAPETVSTYLPAIADANRFNPVTAWLKSIVWDGCDRWPVLYEILGIADDDTPSKAQYRSYVRKWFLQCVAMAFNDGFNTRSADGALVLQGPQGCGKTLFFRRMSVCRQWFVEGASIDFANKDTIIKSLGAWITELGELDSTLKREQSALKAFITSESDDLRAPYARSSVLRVRHTSFCGTVNPERFLRDETGSRRFWVVPVDHIDVDRLLNMSHDMVAQIWGQAYREWCADIDGYRLSRKERDFLSKGNTSFEAEVQWQEEIEDLLDFDLPDDQRVDVTAAWLARSVLRGGASAVAVGRALGAVAKEHPNVENVRTNSKRLWRLPLKKTIALTFGAA